MKPTLVGLVVTALSSSALAEDRVSVDPASFAVVKQVSATSTLAGKTKDFYAAWRALAYTVVDDVPKTNWCEGKPDEGIGETLTIELATPTKLDHLGIFPGVQLTDKLFAANNRITALEVSLDGKPPIKVAAGGKRGDELKVPVGKAVTTIAIKIAAVDKGKMNDSCIAGVNLYAAKDARLAPVFDPAAAAALPAAVAALSKALAAPDRAGLAALASFPLTSYSSVDEFDGLAPIKFANAKALSACKGKQRCPELAKPTDDAEVFVDSPTEVEIVFPTGYDHKTDWHLTWTGGAWKATELGIR